MNVSAAVLEALAPHFVLSDGLRLFHVGEWPACISVSGGLLDAVSRGDTVDGVVSVSGSVTPIGSSLVEFRWLSITFTCENGSATYDFDEQDDWCYKRDVWAGRLRESDGH